MYTVGSQGVIVTVWNNTAAANWIPFGYSSLHNVHYNMPCTNKWYIYHLVYISLNCALMITLVIIHWNWEEGCNNSWFWSNDNYYYHNLNTATSDNDNTMTTVQCYIYII